MHTQYLSRGHGYASTRTLCKLLVVLDNDIWQPHTEGAAKDVIVFRCRHADVNEKERFE